MNESGKIETVAIIGAGLIGTGWAVSFLIAGISIRLFDANTERLSIVEADIAQMIGDMERAGLVASQERSDASVTICGSIEQAVSEAEYVQESVLETVDAKREICTAIGMALNPRTLVGSSSSGIPASKFTEHLSNREQFFVVHPANPPHLVPVVEIVPAPWSTSGGVQVIRRLMDRIGKRPVVLNREIDGFLLNRLQGALLNEAWSLFSEGYATVADIDRTISDGLGLRWAFMGPFETIDLNAPGGVTDYAARLSGLYFNISESRCPPTRWSQAAISAAAHELDAQVGDQSREYRTQARDRNLMALLALKAKRSGTS